VAREGGGFNPAPVIGGAIALVRAFTGGSNKQTMLNRYRGAGPSPPIRMRLGGAPRNVIYSQAPGTPTPAGPIAQPSALDVAGFIAQLTQYLVDLFTQPSVSYGRFIYPTPPEVTEVPYIVAPTGSMGGGGSPDWLGGAGTLAQGIGALIAGIRSNSQAMPGGMRFSPAVQNVLSGYGLMGPDFSNVTSGSSTTAGACPTSAPFAAAGARATPTMFVVPNPVTGRPTWFKPAGRPLLWSGDLRAAKMVRRVARLAKRHSGGR
jgi:hypothetical protein